ncbi:hypothetical protein M441DRAFT_354727 [Trichoderma asperellum CBS 433.97]|uniref:Uncharacterized protein n=1 Tax=Trichoderma asperellum (strain ATCC 204424 / CBS 433.97 / NBRC 101777) TaxID=1042311 RepID=A0A2T3ZIU7_TRIA4|nr:hypothetical protein M441DRAFT_354727 [Trichoderma asperellum CBS 433.97]PTB44738.1 hypothetical protein M441DRAFT_354727 [Trichoderma asperellum CBS 433.97]
MLYLTIYLYLPYACGSPGQNNHLVRMSSKSPVTNNLLHDVLWCNCSELPQQISITRQMPSPYFFVSFFSPLVSLSRLLHHPI